MVWTCDEDWVNKCMESRVEGRIPVGRPRRTWQNLRSTGKMSMTGTKIWRKNVMKRKSNPIGKRTITDNIYSMTLVVFTTNLIY